MNTGWGVGTWGSGSWGGAYIGIWTIVYNAQSADWAVIPTQ
jgi:hypothetical protein